MIMNIVHSKSQYRLRHIHMKIIHAPKVDLQLLECFQALFEERHVSRAAMRIGVTQSAMSHTLNRLRLTYADPLFTRSAQGMVPSPRAMSLAEPIREVLMKLELVSQSEPAFDPGSSQMSLKIMASDFSVFSVLPQVASALEKLAPGMRIEAKAANYALIPELLEKREIDFAIAYIPMPPPRLHCRLLFTQRYVNIVRKGHPALTKPWDKEAFASYPHIEIVPDGAGFCEKLIDSAMDEAGIQRHKGMRVFQSTVAPWIVARSDHVASVLEHVAKQFEPMLPIQILPIPFDLPAMNFYLFWHESTHKSVAHSWMREVIYKATQGMSPVQ